MKLTAQFSMTEPEKCKAKELWNIEGVPVACGHVLVFLRGIPGAKQPRGVAVKDDMVLCMACRKRIDKIENPPQRITVTYQ